jgi:hypothetical protein
MIGMSEKSRYRTMVKKLRANLADETDCLYLLHTPLGIINVSSWNYFTPGFIAVVGEDENKKYRCIVFSEEAVCSFPLEVKRKKAKSTEATLGFKPSFKHSE